MRKFVFAAVFSLALCGVSRADGYTVTAAQGAAVISEVNAAIADNPLAFALNPDATKNFVLGTTDYNLGMALEGVGLISAADMDFNNAAAAFNAVLKDIGSSDPVSFAPAVAEPATLLMLGLGLIGVAVLRKIKSPVPTA